MVVESLDVKIEQTRIRYKNDVNITISQHTENADVVRTVY